MLDSILSTKNKFSFGCCITILRSGSEFLVDRKERPSSDFVNLLKPTGHVMHQQFNIQQLYALPTLYLCVLYLSENKRRLVPLAA